MGMDNKAVLANVTSPREEAAASDWLERARQVAPVLEAASSRIEAQNELTDDVLSLLRQNGLLRLLMPHALGGAAVNPSTFVQVIEALAHADASTAWCVCQTSICSMVTAYMDASAAGDMFAAPAALLAWGVGPNASAVAVDGGYRVSGTWMFGSGSRHATWLGGHCAIVNADGTPQLDRNGAAVERTMLFPRRSADVQDTWRVMGLRGTGSDTYSVKDLFVPAAFTSPVIANWLTVQPCDPAILYRFTGSALYAAGFGALALGNARGMLDTFLRLAGSKTPRGASNPLSASAVVQMHVAQSEAQLRSARLLVLDTLTQAEASIAQTGRITLDQRMAIRMAGTFAIHQATEVLERAYRSAGTTAIFESQPFERRFRDGYSISQHLQGRLAHFELVGKHLLGIEVDPQFL